MSNNFTNKNKNSTVLSENNCEDEQVMAISNYNLGEPNLMMDKVLSDEIKVQEKLIKTEDGSQ